MKLDVIRAWKDEAYRASLSEEQLAMLPANPIGEVELSDSELAGVYGGTTKWSHHHRRHHSHHHRHYWRREDDCGDEDFLRIVVL